MRKLTPASVILSALFASAVVNAADVADADSSVPLGTVLRRKDGGRVSACRCAGPGSQHGHCGFHFHLGSNEVMPWCRTLDGCGTGSFRGSWAFCDVRGVERRRNEDGELFTAKDFSQHYGKKGGKMWVAAKEHAEKRMFDGHAFTAFELRQRHLDAWGEVGWVEKWAVAKPGGSQETHEDVQEKAAEKSKECSCRGSAATHGYCGYHLHLGSSESKPWCRTEDSCGEQSVLKGSWAYCDDRTVEQRRLEDGNFYTSRNLKDKFGKAGAKKWQEAKPFIERRMSGSLALTAAEMHDYHIDAWGEKGWAEQWVAAPPERRKAPIPMYHEFQSFVNYYGDGARQAWLDGADGGGRPDAGQEL